MSKALSASCVSQVVSIGGVPVQDATILSEGVGQSQGVAILEEALVTYLTSNASDIKAAIIALNSMIAKIATVLSSIDAAVMSNANAATIAAIVSENALFLAKKDTLK